jgi:hypothetical protein
VSERLREALRIEADEQVQVTAGVDVALEPCDALQLQPRQAAWIDLDIELRESILAFELRRYSTACVGTPLLIRYDRREYIFDVLHVEPHSDESDLFPGVLLLNTDVGGDFVLVLVCAFLIPIYTHDCGFPPVDVIEPKEPIQTIDTLELKKPIIVDIDANQYVQRV